MTLAPFRVLFGRGRFREVGRLARELSCAALVVTGRSSGRAGPLLELLAQADVGAERECDRCRESHRRAGVQPRRTAGLGAVYGFAGPGGGRFDTADGAICTALLPAVMNANIKALQTRAPNDRTLERYIEVARLMTGRADATARDGVEVARALCRAMKIRSLGALGVAPDAIPDLVGGARRASSMRRSQGAKAGPSPSS